MLNNQGKIYYFFTTASIIFILLVHYNVFFAQKNENQSGKFFLDKVSKWYEIGLFDKVITNISDRLENNKTSLTKAEKIEAYHLLAVSYMAIDSMPAVYVTVSEILKINPNYTPSIFESSRYVNIVNELKDGNQEILVTSVSKKAEDPLKAPATVMVISEEDIFNRGYQDFVDVLSDQPGFDITRLYSATYANIYQRGFRQNNTERTLFLIDGIEENDLWSNIAYISRQYPLSNVKRIEIVHGPASTLYGANAFVGVVNIITKKTSDLLLKKKYHANVNISLGNWNTYDMDMSFAFGLGDVAFSVTGRFFVSDEMSLSSETLFDFDPNKLHEEDYAGVMNVISNNVEDNELTNAESFLVSNSNFFLDSNAQSTLSGISDTSKNYVENVLQVINESSEIGHKYYDVVKNDNGRITTLKLTEEGKNTAVNSDATNYNTIINGHRVSFTNHTVDWLINAKMSFKDFVLGLQTWRREEGATTYFNDINEGGSRNGSVWIPSSTYIYINYEKSISDNLFISSQTNYRVNSLDPETRAILGDFYINGVLGNNTNAAFLLREIPAAYWHPIGFYQNSRQLRSELKFIYTPFPNIVPGLDIVSGIEFRSSSFQGNYVNATNDVFTASIFGYRTLDINSNNWFDNVPIDSTNRQYDIFDFGTYTQATWKFLDVHSLTMGLRYDYNRIQNILGFGGKYNPRFAYVFSPNKFILKIFYAQGIQNVSQWAKFSQTGSRLPNPDLQTEKIRNLEMSVSYKTDNMLVTFSEYYSIIDSAISLVPYDGRSRHEHIFEYSILGTQVTLNYKFTKYLDAFFNYSYTIANSVPSNSQDIERKVGDIAPHKVNFGVNYKFIYLSHAFNFNIRSNYVSERPVGVGTTVPTNTEKFDHFMVFNASLIYKNARYFSGFSFQVTANNLFNTMYYHPGPRDADGGFYANRILQRSRYFIFKVNYNI